MYTFVDKCFKSSKKGVAMDKIKMLKKLKDLVVKEGETAIAVKLGYHAPITIKRWLNAKRIPKIALIKVEKLLNKKGQL